MEDQWYRFKQVKNCLLLKWLIEKNAWRPKTSEVWQTERIRRFDRNY
jgi:hypothetical protein